MELASPAPARYSADSGTLSKMPIARYRWDVLGNSIDRIGFRDVPASLQRKKRLGTEGTRGPGQSQSAAIVVGCRRRWQRYITDLAIQLCWDSLPPPKPFAR